MVETVSLDALTDEEIEALSVRRIKAAVGDNLAIIGSTDPGHNETLAECECTLCRNGQRLNKAGKAVCLRCSRASKQIDRIIESVKTEERILQSIAAKKRVDMIKVRAAAQRMGRRGAKMNPANKKAVIDAIRNSMSATDSATENNAGRKTE